MESLETLKARIEGARGLRSIVRTMKVLAAVGLRQDAKAREALADYAKGIELGLQVVLRSFGPSVSPPAKGSAILPCLEAIVLGSDLGMCGQFNERMAEFAARELRPLSGYRLSLFAVGEGLARRLEDFDLTPSSVYPCPSNPTTGLDVTIRKLLAGLAAWKADREDAKVLVFFTSHEGGQVFCRSRVLLPVDVAYLEALRARPWNSRSLPLFKMEGRSLLHACLRETLFVFLHGAFLDSLESENAARLDAMRQAERHIDEGLSELRSRYNEARQEAITAELLDIVAGVEAAMVRPPMVRPPSG
ncbi:MAG TPA: FoF1 ATP synthase subunit gamma [Rectinemataceae bacterium]|nr:FoF1 ATP synthase subunit gamma [Rectinemataceae bacterium]